MIPAFRTRVKICGITRPEDALLVAEAGADAVGLNFYQGSKRFVNEQQARAILAVLPPFVTRVGLFVNADAGFVNGLADTLQLDLLQFHGDETPEYCNNFSRPWLKVLRVKPEFDLQAEIRAFDSAAGILLDAWDPHEFGGTGRVFDWQQLKDLDCSHLILAGGLNPDNVRDAIIKVRPWAVDVSSGVESAPGIKSAALVTSFMTSVQDAL